MLNLLLYYPRVFTALIFRPAPSSYATLQHWLMAHLFILWNTPWRDRSDTIGIVAVSNATKTKREDVNPSEFRTRVVSEICRGVYLFAILTWPAWSFVFALRQKRNWYRTWTNQINSFAFCVSSRSRLNDAGWKEPLSSFTFYVTSLYIFTRTGVRIPELKNITNAYCELYNIPTPRVYTESDAPLPAGEYIVKPIDGACARGIFFTTEPDPYLSDHKLIVQQVVKTSRQLRQIWGTDTVGSIRFITRVTPEGRCEVAGAVLRIPLGEDVRFDNTSQGNGYALVDCTGRLSRCYNDKERTVGVTNHPFTGAPIEGVVLEDYDKCVELALKSHELFGAGVPVFNTDVAQTEGGPVLIEVNRSPGQYNVMYINGFSQKCVESFCWGIAKARSAARPAAGAGMPGQIPTHATVARLERTRHVEFEETMSATS